MRKREEAKFKSAAANWSAKTERGEQREARQETREKRQERERSPFEGALRPSGERQRQRASGRASWRASSEQ